MGPEDNNNGFRTWNRWAWNITKKVVVAFEYNLKRIRLGIDIDIIEKPFCAITINFLFFQFQVWRQPNDR